MNKIFLGGLLIFLVAGSIFLINNNNLTYDLTKDFGITGKVVHSATYTSDEEMLQKIQEYFSSRSQAQKLKILIGGGDEDITIVNWRGSNTVEVINYEEITNGIINFPLRSNPKYYVKEYRYTKKILSPDENNRIEVLINGEKRTFQLEEGKNLFLIIENE